MWPFIVTLCGHSLCWVCVCAGQRISLSALARNLHKGLRARSTARPEVNEERKVSEKTESQLTKEDEGMQSTTEEVGWLEIRVQGKDVRQKEAEDSQR